MHYAQTHHLLATDILAFHISFRIDVSDTSGKNTEGESIGYDFTAGWCHYDHHRLLQTRRQRSRDLGRYCAFWNAQPRWGTATSAPWRAGANENTVISFSTDVKFNGVEVEAGSYALFMVVEEDGTVEVILSFLDRGGLGEYRC